MSRLSLIAVPLFVAASMAAGTPVWAAKNPACKSSRWSLTLPQGSTDQSTVIIDGAENQIWRVGAGGVPGSAMLIIEYRSTSGIKGELVLQSGAAEFVEGSTVTMHLRRMAPQSGAIAVAGTYGLKC
jgi:hypothetical protein